MHHSAMIPVILAASSMNFIPAPEPPAHKAGAYVQSDSGKMIACHGVLLTCAPEAIMTSVKNRIALIFVKLAFGQAQGAL